MSKRPPPSAERPGGGHPALERAVLALQMQRPVEAEHLASQVLKANRTNVAAAQILGRALLMQNRVTEAIVPLEKAARRTEDPVIETLLGSALASTGRSGEAIEQLRLAITRRPPYPLAFAELGGQLSKLGRIEEGLTTFDRGLALAPNDSDLLMGLGYLQLKINGRAKARALFLQVQAADPRRFDVHSALGNVMALDGEYAAAAEHFQRVLALRPNDAMMQYNLGKCLLELGQRDAGEAALRAAASAGLEMAAGAINALSAASHGRFFLRPSVVTKFLRAKP